MTGCVLRLIAEFTPQSSVNPLQSQVSTSKLVSSKSLAGSGFRYLRTGTWGT